MPKKYQLIGGALCLDLCNTVGGTREGIARENLHSYEHFLEWCKQAGVVSDPEAATLQQEQMRNPGQSAEVLNRVVELREAIYRIFMALARQGTPAQPDLAILNGELERSLKRLQVSSEPNGKGFAWTWAKDHMTLDYPLGPLAHSAADLLIAQGGCCRIRQCHADNCGWLFVDSSKNHSRCWCDMRDCGNRAKVRRHRQKRRGLA